VTSVADCVSIAPRYSRSTNLERDSQAVAALHGYVLTGRVLDVLDRLTASILSDTGGAWSITGPYGSGKSSLAVFLDALFGPVDTPAFTRAVELVKAVDPESACRFDKSRDIAGSQGFIRVTVTARTEPVTHTLARALDNAVRQFFGRIPTRRQFPEIALLRAAIDDSTSVDPRRTGPSPGSLLEVVTALAEIAPVLIIIDEFGKNLEAAKQRQDADLYMMQLLAEAAQTDRGSAIYLLTLQHLAFDEYSATDDTAQQREWAKIQGRFEDVAFVDSAAQTRKLIASAFSVDEEIAHRVAGWAASRVEELAHLRLPELADSEEVASCYPLDPVSLAVLPELCRRYGQNERTLFSFLTGGAPNAVPALLRARSARDLPTINLADIYNYFVDLSSLGVATSRLSEIALRIRDAANIEASDLEVAKGVAILNLVSTNGPLRASRELIRSSFPDGAEALGRLEAEGLVTYRRSSDEYRIWQGTGLDLDALMRRAEEQVRELSNSELLRRAAPLEPHIATGHTMRTDTLRTFERRYLGAGDEIDLLPVETPFDGLSYFVLSENLELPGLNPADLPLVLQRPRQTSSLIDLAVEVSALKLVGDDSNVVRDWVARAEIAERQAIASRRLAEQIDITAGTSDWQLVSPDGLVDLTPGPGSAALSDAADRVFFASPRVRNETLNRVELTTQGAKARRLLLLAMLDRENEQGLGLTGSGPEVAMYDAFVKNTGMHRFDRRHGHWAILPPKDKLLRAAWDAVRGELHRATDRRVSLADIHAVLRSPPIGMKPGAIPVLVTGVLIATKDTVALYEHGTFRPVLSEAVCDRMVRNPAHFEVKYYANATGIRREVVEAVSSALGIEPSFRKQRVGNVLAVVSELVSRISSLPPYTVQADDVTVEARQVRETIATATEPDDLVFRALPETLGLEPFGLEKAKRGEPNRFAKSLKLRLDELSNHYSNALRELFDEVLVVARERDRHGLVMQARALSEDVIDPDLRSFVFALGAEDFEDQHWVENLATVITRSAPRLWSNDERRRFSVELNARLAAFRRVLLLHSEMRSLDGQLQDAQRITLTSSDGREDAVLVAISDEERNEIRELADGLIEELAEVLGRRDRAEKILLAWAAERVMAPKAH